MVYQGSKTRYAKYIVPILQDLIDKNEIKIFIDGCCGGCNIIDKIQCDKKIAIDLNKYLIDLYRHVISNGTADFPAIITKKDWDDRKNNPDQEPLWMTALISFFCSYSARGFSGGYALNGSRDFYHERLRNFENQIPGLRDIDFVCNDICNIDYSGALIYIDPPYKDTKQYDISKNFNYEKFWNKVRALSENNIVIVSEQQAPEDFECIWELNVTRNTFGKKGNTQTTEKLFRYNPRLNLEG